MKDAQGKILQQQIHEGVYLSKNARTVKKSRQNTRQYRKTTLPLAVKKCKRTTRAAMLQCQTSSAASTLQEKQFNKGTQLCKAVSVGMQEKHCKKAIARETHERSNAREQCSHAPQQKH